MKYITKYIYAIKREFQDDCLLINAQTTLITRWAFTELAVVRTFFRMNVRLKNGNGRKIALTTGSSGTSIHQKAQVDAISAN